MKDVKILTSNGVNVTRGIELMGNQENYDELIGDFLTEAAKKIASIEEYKKSSDMENYSILVHTLKSDGKQFGFEKLAELAYNHEIESKNNNIDYVNANYDELMKEVHRIVGLVKEYLGTGQETNDENDNNQLGLNKYATLLVVDDSIIIRNFIQKIFNDQFEVLVANDGREAINIISQNAYKLVGVLLDLNMPDVDGFQVLDYFKEKSLFDKIPVSIITGVDSREKLEKAFQYPIVDILKKPFNEDDVKKIVERTIKFKNYDF